MAPINLRQHNPIKTMPGRLHKLPHKLRSILTGISWQPKFRLLTLSIDLAKCF